MLANHYNALFKACETGDLSIVEKVLDISGIDVNKRNQYGEPPLYIATQSNHPKIVEKLLKSKNIDVNKQNDIGTTALYIASKNANMKILDKLLENPKIDVNKSNNNGATPLYVASQYGRLEVVDTLMNNPSIDINKSMINGSTPLIIASQNGHANVVEKLMTHSEIDINKFMQDGTSPLIVASQYNRIEVVEKLLTNPSIDINKSYQYGDFPLYIASSKGYAEIVEKLIAMPGIDVNKLSRARISSLFIACKNGYVEIVKKLLAVPGIDKKAAEEEAKKGKFKEEINELFKPKKYKILWTGFSRSDISFTNDVFNQVVDTNLSISNPTQSLFSMCPVCLKYIEHSSGSCMYMTHSCVEQAGYEGYYHKELWNAFSYGKQYDAFGRLIPVSQQKKVIEWCTLCGRICKGHRHYKLAPVFSAGRRIQIPEFAGDAGGGDFFATDCSKPSIGGGGLREKIHRYREFREMVLMLNKPRIIGKITYEDAIDMLVEAMWEAPLSPMNSEIQKIQSNKRFDNNVSNNRFPLPSELPPPPKYIYSDPSYPDAMNPALFPVVYPIVTNAYKNSAYNTFGDDENIVQFRHRMADGKVNTHEGKNQQIALGRLMGYIKHMNDSPTSDDFGMCWQFSKDGYTIVNDTTKMPPKCTAKLYPEELLHAIESASYTSEHIKEEYIQIYQYYQKLFAEKFGEPIGLAKNMEGGRKTRRILKTRRHSKKHYH